MFRNECIHCDDFVENAARAIEMSVTNMFRDDFNYIIVA